MSEKLAISLSALKVMSNELGELHQALLNEPGSRRESAEKLLDVKKEIPRLAECVALKASGGDTHEAALALAPFKFESHASNIEALAGDLESRRSAITQFDASPALGNLIGGFSRDGEHRFELVTIQQQLGIQSVQVSYELLLAAHDARVAAGIREAGI